MKGFSEKNVIEKFPDLQESYIQLIVFAGLRHVCSTFLEEAPQWAVPLTSYAPHQYGITLFTPNDVPGQTRESFLEMSGLSMENVVFYGRDDPIAALHSFGVLKVLFSQEFGVLWIDLGSETPQQQAAFSARLHQTLLTNFPNEDVGEF